MRHFLSCSSSFPGSLLAWLEGQAESSTQNGTIMATVIALPLIVHELVYLTAVVLPEVSMMLLSSVPRSMSFDQEEESHSGLICIQQFLLSFYVLSFISH